jgi:O-antigen/teichoic acid export membrane protein
MSKAADMAKVSAEGGFHLMWGLVISTVISSVGTIFIARLLGSDLYGLYGVILVAPSLIAVFRDWGINSAMVRCTAQRRVEDKPIVPQHSMIVDYVRFLLRIRNYIMTQQIIV